MKNRFFSFLTLAILFVTAISFQSCSDEKYTVWTDSGTYAEFQSAFGTTLNDGYYVRMELTSDQWAQISKNLTSEGKHRWSEETIKKWFISNGFGETEANKETSWIVVIDHGFLATRTGNIVYYILK